MIILYFIHQERNFMHSHQIAKTCLHDKLNGRFLHLLNKVPHARFIDELIMKCIPIRDRTISTHAPNSTALRLPIFVTAMVCTFSVRVVEPVPIPQRPANTLERPSRPIPRLKTPAVGGLDATNNDEA